MNLGMGRSSLNWSIGSALEISIEVSGFLPQVSSLFSVLMYKTINPNLLILLNLSDPDIPSQARDLYKINKVRMLYDRDQPTARLMCKSQEELGKPLNMTHCHLRAMSPIHIKYLANMGVVSCYFLKQTI